MKKRFWLYLLTALLWPTLAMAQSVFDGTWKIDPSTFKFSEKQEYLLKDGMYHCKSCVPPIDVKADGQDQKVSGHPYYDTVSVKVVDDRTIEQLMKKNGKTVITERMAVSPDGDTLMDEVSDSSATNADPVTGKVSETRVLKGPAGSHAVSGSWSIAKVESVSENAVTFTLKVVVDSLTMSNLTGQGYTAKLDGTEAPYKGDPGTTSVSVKEIDANTLQETDKRDGKVISVGRSTVSADGKSMKIVVDDKLHETRSEFTATKQ